MNTMQIQNSSSDNLEWKHDRGSFLRSELGRVDSKQDILTLSSEFIDTFSQSKDKASFLKLSGIPLEILSDNGGPVLKLINAKIETDWHLGTAGPSFGSTELSYLPYPGELITSATNMIFTYVSIREKIERNLIDWIVEKYFPELETK